ncbi:MAG: hypothetical protein AB1331_05920 [Bacillota bacterium]
MRWTTLVRRTLLAIIGLALVLTLWERSWAPAMADSTVIGPGRAAIWHPDGQAITIINVDGIRLHQLADHTEYYLVRDPGCFSAAWAPGGRYLAYLAVEGGKSSLRVLDLQTRHVSPVTDSAVERYAWIGPDQLVFGQVWPRSELRIFDCASRDSFVVYRSESPLMDVAATNDYLLFTQASDEGHFEGYRLPVALAASGRSGPTPEPIGAADYLVPDRAGRHLAAVRISSEDGLYLVDTETGLWRKAAAGIVLDLAWSPAGHILAFTRGGKGHTWNLMLLSGSRLRQLTQGKHVTSPAWSPDGRALVVAVYELSKSPSDYGQAQIHLIQVDTGS